MPPDSLKLDMLESLEFAKELGRYQTGAAGRANAEFLSNDYLLNLTDDTKAEIRRIAGFEEARFPGNVEEIPADLEKRHPYFAIMRNVATRMAIAYFKNLKLYLSARKTGVKEIDTIREEVAVSSALLLRQIEDVMPFIVPRQRDLDPHGVRYNLRRWIDFEKVTKESGFSTLTGIPRGNHYNASVRGKPLGDTDNYYSGLKAQDVLLYLNSADDATLHFGEECREDNRLGVIKSDGTIDIEYKKPVEKGSDAKLQELQPDEIDLLAGKIAFSGEAEEFKGKKLTVETLRQNDLLPKYKATIEGKTVYVTGKLFNETYALAYVESGDQIIARAYWRSRSQTVWRLIPSYLEDFFNGGGIILHKADCEDSLNVPPSFQKILCGVDDETELSDAKAVILGTTHCGAPAQSLILSTDKNCRELGENFYIDIGKPGKIDPRNPESFKFKNIEDKPDFTEIIDTWQDRQPMYGNVTFEVFNSKNEELQYIFCRDEKGRAWIGGIFIQDSDVNTFGIKEQWVKAGDLTTPAYEYRYGQDQTGGYGNESDRHGNYVDMFRHYLRHIPVIKEYLESVAKRKTA